MSDAEIKRLADNSELIDTIQHTRRIIKIWEELRDLEHNDEITSIGAADAQAQERPARHRVARRRADQQAVSGADTDV